MRLESGIPMFRDGHLSLRVLGKMQVEAGTSLVWHGRARGTSFDGRGLNVVLLLFLVVVACIQGAGSFRAHSIVVHSFLSIFYFIFGLINIS